MPAAEKLFGEAAFYLDVIDTIAPIALHHEYTFFADEWFAEWIKSKTYTVERLNFILALELIDKSHLAALTALMRAKRWADATCLMYDNTNLVGWAASVRGLLESAGDTVDGLLNIPLTLAVHRRSIRRCLAGEEREIGVGYSELEAKLDHFVQARWMRTKRGEDNKLKAKENAAYVGILEPVIPGVLKLYHQLCALCHPSQESVEYFYANPGHHGRLKLSPTNDAKEINAICTAYPSALHDALMMSCNSPLYILRVLHKFGVHPKLELLRKLNWKAIEMGAEIEQHLKS